MNFDPVINKFSKSCWLSVMYFFLDLILEAGVTVTACDQGRVRLLSGWVLGPCTLTFTAQ